MPQNTSCSLFFNIKVCKKNILGHPLSWSDEVLYSQNYVYGMYVWAGLFEEHANEKEDDSKFTNY